MSHQLWYTSAERGLTPGSRGFCTVKATRGIPQPLAQRLESLSGYAHLFSPKANGNPDNPVAYHFIHLQQGGRTWYVLSRVCDAGLDYSGRTNKFAHHVVLDRDELPPAGPAWLMSQPGFFDEAWDGTVGIVDSRKPIARHDRPPAPCERWQQAAGDAGWAGVLAESAIQTAMAPAHVIVPADVSALPLLEEALALLPPEVRWSTTFSTLFTDQFPADVSLRWRVLIDGTREAARAANIHHQPVINLTQRRPVPASLLSPGVEAARQGTLLRPPATTGETPHHAAALSFSERAFGTGRVGPVGSPPPMSLRRAAPRPAGSSPLEISRIEPIRTVTNYPTRPSALNVLLVTSLPMLLLGLVLGIAVQWRWPVLPLSKGKDVASASDIEQSPAETENQAKTAADAGDGTANPPEKSSSSEDGKKPETAAEGSAASPDQTASSGAERGKTEAKSSGDDEPSKEKVPKAPPDSTDPAQGEAEQSPAPTATRKEDSEWTQTPEDHSFTLDATKSRWTIRKIDHSLSKMITIGLIEEKPADGNASETTGSLDSFHFLIVEDRLIGLKPWGPQSNLQVQRLSKESSDKTEFPLAYGITIPEWLSPIFSINNKNKDVNKDVRVQLEVNAITLQVEFDDSQGSQCGDGTPNSGNRVVEYKLEKPWKLDGVGDQLVGGTLKFDADDGNATENAGTGSSGVPDTEFECDAKIQLDSGGSALQIEIHDPKLPSQNAVRRVTVTRMEGCFVLDIIPQELKETRIRVLNEEWIYSGDKSK